MRFFDRPPVRVVFFTALALVYFVVGCDDHGLRPEGAVGPETVWLEVLGVGWTSPAGLPLRDSVLATVDDTLGQPLSGVATTWRVSAGGGSIDPSQVLTDASGTVKVKWTLGPEPGVNRAIVTATVGERTLAEDTVTATGSNHALYRVRFLGEFGAADLNEVGQVAGTWDNGDGQRRAILWDDGEIVELGTLGRI